MRDPGLQPERTTLAWSRTGFSLALVGLLLCRDGVRHHGSVVLAAGTFITLASLGMLVLARWRRRSLAENPGTLPVHLARCATGLVLAASLAEAWSLFF